VRRCGAGLADAVGAERICDADTGPGGPPAGAGHHAGQRRGSWLGGESERPAVADAGSEHSTALTLGDRSADPFPRTKTLTRPLQDPSPYARGGGPAILQRDWHHELQFPQPTAGAVLGAGIRHY